jgi:hypothetical protein
MNNLENLSLTRKTLAITLLTIGVTSIAYGTVNALDTLTNFKK